jgi:hypothetical protein
MEKQNLQMCFIIEVRGILYASCDMSGMYSSQFLF